MTRVYSEKEIWGNLDLFFASGDWDDPLKHLDPSDPFYGLPSPDAKILYEIMSGQPLK